MFENKVVSHRRNSYRDRFESLEARRALAADGVSFGPFLAELTEVHPRVDEIVAAIQSNLSSATELDLQSPLVEAEFETPLEVDVFAINTPALSPEATGNGSLFVSSFAYSTGAPSVVVVTDAEGVATNASVSLLPGLGFTEIDVQPESTYYIGVGQVEGIEGFPLEPSDAQGPYQLDVGYFEPLPPPPEPVDVEPDLINEALPIESGIATGYLQAGNDIDYFKVTAATDGTLHFFLDAAPFVAAEFRLEDADGQLLSSEVAMFGPVEFALDVTADETYFVSLRGEDASGFYNLFVNEEVFVEQQPPVDRHGDSIEKATDVTDRGPFWLESGVINSADDVDWFRVSNADGPAPLVQFIPNESIFAELVDADGIVLHTFTADDSLVQDTGLGEFYVRVASLGETNASYDFLLLQVGDAFGWDPDLGIVDLPALANPTVPAVPDKEVPAASTEDLVGDDFQTATPLAGLEEIGIPGLLLGQGALNGLTDFGVLDVDVFSAELPEGVSTIMVSTFNAEEAQGVTVTVSDADGVLLVESSANAPTDLAVNSVSELFVSVTSESAVLLDYEVSVWTELPEVVRPAEPPRDLSLDEVALALGISIDELLSGDSSEGSLGGVQEEAPSFPFVPEELAWEELVELLGIPVNAPSEETLVDQAFVDQALGELPGAGSQAADELTFRVGDIDLDNQVGFSDFLIMSEYFGTQAGAEWQHGNFDGDGDVDFTDFLQLSNAYGS